MCMCTVSGVDAARVRTQGFLQFASGNTTVVQHSSIEARRCFQRRSVGVEIADQKLNIPESAVKPLMGLRTSCCGRRICGGVPDNVPNGLAFDWIILI
jgi:hypothetical protein